MIFLLKTPISGVKRTANVLRGPVSHGPNQPTSNDKKCQAFPIFWMPCSLLWSERFLIFPFDATTSRILNFTTKVVGLFVVPSSRPYIFTKILVRLAKDLSTPKTS
jgi:hypothetical protein